MRIVILLLLLLHGTLTARNLPDWMSDHADLLPDVSDQVVETLRGALPESQLSDGHNTNEPLPAKFVKACRTIGNLGHDASKAMIWLYVEDPPRLKFRDTNLHNKKGELIENLFGDTDAAKWLVPILRLRLEWAAKQIRDETVAQTWFSGSELGSIGDYMAIHGTDDDLRRAYQIQEEFRGSPGSITPFQSQQSPEERWRTAMWRRQSKLGRAKPYCDKFRQILSMPAIGFLHKSEQPVIHGENSREIRTQANLNSSAHTGPTPSEEPTSSTPWSIIVVLIVAAFGLLCLVLKRRS